MIRRIYIRFSTLLPGLLFIASGILVTPVFGGDNKAWNTNAQSGYFWAPNWSYGTTGAGSGTEWLNSYDSLHFDTSTRVTLTNNLAEATFENVTFNEGASAYTIYGNWFYLSGIVANRSTNSQTIYNDIVLTRTEQQVDVAAGSEIVLAGRLSGKDYGLYKLGAGRLRLTGSNTYTGRTYANQGTLVLADAESIARSINVTTGEGAVLDVSAFSGEFQVATGQTVGGRGTINRPVRVPAGGTLAVSEGLALPGVLTVNNGLTLEGTTFLSIREGVGTEADKIQVTGESTTTLKFGGTLVLTNLNSFPIYDPPHSYTLFSAPKFSGKFTGLVIQPLSDSRLRVDISQLREGGDGTIKILNGNQAPKATNVVLMVEQNGTVSFELAKYASDPDGDFVTPIFEGVETTERMTFTNGVVTYRPAGGTHGNREFTYWVSDPSGLLSTESSSTTISVEIVQATGNGGSILSVSPSAEGPVTVWFAGIPGGIYQGQFSIELASGTWTDVGAPVTVGGNGKGSFVHVGPPSSAFYRTRWVGGGAATE